VLVRLSAAIEAEDMGRVRAVWISITSEAAQGLEALFAGASDMAVNYDVRSVREQGQRIVVSVHTTYRFSMRGDQVAETDQEFELEERNGEWVVVADR
jgi:allophanate hydrolase subunit 1